MNNIKTYLLTLTLISAPLMAMEQEPPHRANPCTQFKTALVLGLALFAGKALHDCQTVTPDMFDPSMKPAVAMTIGNGKVTTYTYGYYRDENIKTPKDILKKPLDLKDFGIDEDNYRA